MSINPSASQSEEGNEQDRHSEEEIREYYEAFGIDYPSTEGSEEEREDPDIDSGDEDPAIDPANPADIKGLQVKYNGQETLVPDEEVRGYVEKGMNYEKIKGRNQQYESALDRLARQQGYKDHTELLDNLDHIEQVAVQKRKDDFDGLEQSLREDAVSAAELIPTCWTST